MKRSVVSETRGSSPCVPRSDIKMKSEFRLGTATREALEQKNGSTTGVAGDLAAGVLKDLPVEDAGLETAFFKTSAHLMRLDLHFAAIRI